MSKREQARRSYDAMMKFASDRQLSDADWQDLSWLTLIDRTNLEFGPGNTRWALTDAERADNLKFYRSLGQPS